jgi:hypothetical protein
MISLVMASCSTFQFPRVLEKGEQSFTASVSSSYPFSFDITAEYRTNLAKSLDLGLRLTYNAGIAAIIDVKYQILTQPFYLAPGVGAGVIYVGTIIPVVQALLIGGTDVFYIGIKPMSIFGWGGVATGRGRNNYWDCYWQENKIHFRG